jgi:hypothetical protein
MNRKIILLVFAGAGVVAIILVMMFSNSKETRSPQSHSPQTNEEQAFETPQVSEEATKRNQPLTSEEISQLVDYPIPELGIKLKVPQSVVGELVYAYNEGPVTEGSPQGDKVVGIAKSVRFSAKTLAAFSQFCIAEYGPWGNLTRYEGKPEQYPGPFVRREEGRKLFEDFFILYGGPQASCLTKEEYDKYEASLNEKAKKAVRPNFERLIVLAEEL